MSPLHLKYNYFLLFSSLIVLKIILNYYLIFYLKLKKQPTNPLHPVTTNNTCPLRITATAGTKLVRTYSPINYIIFIDKRVLQTRNLLHSRNITRSSFRSLSNILHCCPLKRLGPFSVPMWLIILSNQLCIVGLLYFYYNNYLIPYKL